MTDDRSPSLPLMRPADAAAYLAISTRQLRDLTRAGSIRYVNIGQRDRETRRYTRDDLDAFIDERRQFAPGRVTHFRDQHGKAVGVIDFAAQRLARRAEAAARKAAMKAKRLNPRT